MTEITKKHFLESLRFPFFFVGLMWIVHIMKLMLGMSLAQFGVLPREIYGLKGIVTGPFIHGDIQHLISNSIPMLMLLTMIFVFYRKVAVKSFVVIYLLTGAAVWLFAHDAFHIGASGVVYGLVSFVFWSGVFRRNIKSIILSLIVIVLYSGYFYGILPNQTGISWESHLFGGLAGILVAYLFKGKIEQDEKVDEYSIIDEPDESQYFLPRDTFDLTREEKQRLGRGYDN
jgi:membrane associated rhomboid family serine protease